jgi:hypothetical protein
LPEQLDINVIARPKAGMLEPAALRKHLEQCFEVFAEKASY